MGVFAPHKNPHAHFVRGDKGAGRMPLCLTLRNDKKRGRKRNKKKERKERKEGRKRKRPRKVSKYN